MSNTNLHTEFSRFVSGFSDETSDQNRAYLAATSFDLFRRFADDPMALVSVSELLGASAHVAAIASFKKIEENIFHESFVVGPYAIVSAGVPEDQVPSVLLLAFELYSDILSSELDAKDMLPFSSVLQAAIAEYGREPFEKPQRSPALFSDSLVRRVFDVKPIAHDFINFVQRIGCALVRYRHVVDDVPQAEIRGWSFSCADDTLFLLLETGEAFHVPAADVTNAPETLSFLTDKQDYKAVSATLLCLLYVSSDLLHSAGIIDDDARHIIKSGFFGAPTVPVTVAPPEKMVEQLLQYMASGSSDSGLFSAASVAGVTVSVMADPVGGAVFSHAAHTETGEILLRNDTPRQISPFGVYLFPLPDQLVSLFLVAHG